MPELIVLYLSAGTRWKMPAPLDEGGNIFHHYLLKENWQLVEQVWIWDSLILVQPGETYAMHIMRGEGRGSREFVGWYVNLQERLRRTAIGFDFMDQELDIVVKSDLSEWHWKDETSFAQAQALGLFIEAQAKAIRAKGEQVIEKIERKASPFNSDWKNWYPPLQWPIPDLLEGWDRV